MPHISITLLPGKSSEQKKSIAREVRRTPARELIVDPLIVPANRSPIRRQQNGTDF